MAVISESLRRLVAAGASSLLRNELDDGPHSASSLSSTLSSTVPDPPSSLPSSLPCTLTSSVLDPPVPVGEPLFPLGWLADYPGLQLKRLDLQFNFPEEESNQTSKFDATREALDLFARSAFCRLGLCHISRRPPLLVGHLHSSGEPLPHRAETRQLQLHWRRRDPWGDDKSHCPNTQSRQTRLKMWA